MADITVRVIAAHSSANGYEVDYHYSTTDGQHGTSTVEVFATSSPAAQNADILDAARTYCVDRFGTTAGLDFMAVGVPGSWVYIPKRTTQQVVSSTVLVDDTALQFPTRAGMFYTCRLRVFFEGASLPDFKYRLTHTTTATSVVRRILRGGANAAPAEVAPVVLFDSADVVLTGSNGNGIVFEDFLFNCGATPGILKFQWAQNVSDATPVKVLEGSYLEWEGRI
jgi:hypothetical protein